MPQGSTPKKGRKPRWYNAFLNTLAKTGNVLRSAQLAHIDRTTAYYARDRDPEFAAAWLKALDDAMDFLEEVAWHRAAEGLERKKFDKGKPVVDPDTGRQYVEREYSDTLLIFLLKGGRPEKYRERLDIDVRLIDDAIERELARLASPGKAEVPGASSRNGHA